MIPAGVVAAFLLGLVLEATFLWWSDRRAIAREAAWWEELRAEALDGYGKMFDWEQLGDA
jgi:hypothetical protein